MLNYFKRGDEIERAGREGKRSCGCGEKCRVRKRVVRTRKGDRFGGDIDTCRG